MSKLNIKKINPEQGQALLGGILSLVFLLILGFYNLYLIETWNRFLYLANTSREHALQNAANLANMLNNISYNNLQILYKCASLINWEQNSEQFALSYVNAIPFWQGDLTTPIHPQFIENIFRNIGNKNQLYTTELNLLSKSNQELLTKIKFNYPEVGKYFSELSAEDTFCLSAKLGFSQSDVLGILNTFQQIPPMQFVQSNCTFTYKNSKGTELKLRSLATEFKNIRLTFVPSDKFGKEFTQALLLLPAQVGSNKLNLAEDKKLWTKLEVTLRMVENKNFPFSLENSPKTSKLARTSPTQITSAVTHPYLKKGKSCSEYTNLKENFLTKNDFTELNSCGINSHEFNKVFFTPNWTPIIAFEELAKEKI